MSAPASTGTAAFWTAAVTAAWREGRKQASSRTGRTGGFWRGPFDFEAGRSDDADGRPRRFLQVKADFLSTKGSSGTALDYLQFEVSAPPSASEVVAEVFPHEVRLGEATSFTYMLRPRIQGDDRGFDSIQIYTPMAPASVDEVRIGQAVLSPGEFSVTPWDGESFSVHIPRVDLETSGELIAVMFQSEVFKAGTAFTGRVYDSSRPVEVRQRVTAGDADPLVEGNTLSINPVVEERRTIRSFEASPFTPNADGINDLLTVEYDLVNLVGGGSGFAGGVRSGGMAGGGDCGGSRDQRPFFGDLGRPGRTGQTAVPRLVSFEAGSRGG